MSVSFTCPECGLDYDSISPRDASGYMRMLPRRYRNVLTTVFRGDEDLEELIRRRPAEGVWSALEYTAHTAQTIDLCAPALRQTVLSEDPHLYTFDPDEQAAEQDYNGWTLLQALAELESACADMSMAIEYHGSGDWSRAGTYDEPTGRREAIDIARNAVHEGVHHLRDIRLGLGTILGRKIDEV